MRTNESQTSTEESPVTVMVTRRVKPGHETEFEASLSGIVAASSAFSGHLGATMFRPDRPGESQYGVVFKFDRESNLQLWLDSPERKEWLARIDKHAAEEAKVRVMTGLETWFTLPSKEATRPLPRYKMAVLTWIAIFPLVTVMLLVLQPPLSILPFPVPIMIMTALLTVLMTYLVMPRLTRLCARWLYPRSPKSPAGTER